MKHFKLNYKNLLKYSALLVSGLFISEMVAAQSDNAPAKPVKNTFQSVWIIDNQTVMVPVKGTLEFDIQHRFGTWDKGYEDMWGFFAPSNIRLGVSYAPIKNLNLGIGITKANMLWDGSAKYAILQQTPGSMPVSVTYYANMAYDTREIATTNDGSELNYDVERFSYFHQLIIARKITENFSLQIAPSISHQNAVSGYYVKNEAGEVEEYQTMKFDHLACAVAARYRLTDVTSIMLNYDQPITQHSQFNPNPNLGIGVEFNTSSHSFQIFASNYALLSQQRNNLYNNNNPFKYVDAVTGKEVEGSKFLLGFNITRLWNY